MSGLDDDAVGEFDHPYRAAPHVRVVGGDDEHEAESAASRR